MEPYVSVDEHGVVYDYDQYLARNNMRVFARLAIALAFVVAVALGFLGVSTYQHANRSLAERINWQDQTHMPMIGSTRDAVVVDAWVAKMFYGQDDDTPKASVEIPTDQWVIIAGRIAIDIDWAPSYFPATPYASACVIERGGRLDEINTVGNRTLMTYSPPSFTIAPFDEKCERGTMLVEELT